MERPRKSLAKLKKLNIIIIFIIIFNLIIFSPNFAQAKVSLSDSGIIFIVDNSGSMAEVFNGDIKVNGAKESINKSIKQTYFDSINMGLLEIGGYCEVKELVSPALNNRQAILTATNLIHPRPYLDASTPIAKSIFEASQKLKQYKGEKRIILVSDGGANCQGNNEFPLSACDMVASLKNQGIDFSLKMIGYGSKSDKELECITSLSDKYDYTPVNSPDEAKKEIERETDFINNSQNWVENLTKFLNSIKELIAAVIAILVSLGFSKRKTIVHNNKIQKW